MRIFRPVVAALAVGAVLLASGCGSGGDPLKGKSADDIVSSAKQSLTSAKSVHLIGTMTDEDGEITFDLTVTGGGEAQGTMKIEGATLELIQIADATFMKADADSWTTMTGEAEAGVLMAGKWLKIPADAADSEDFAGLSEMADLGGIAEQFVPTDAKRRPGTTEVNGTKAVAIEGTDGDGDDVVLYVENSKEAKPIRVEPGKDASTKGHLDFTDWGKTADIKAPADAIDLSSLMGADDAS